MKQLPSWCWTRPSRLTIDCQTSFRHLDVGLVSFNAQPLPTVQRSSRAIGAISKVRVKLGVRKKAARNFLALEGAAFIAAQ